MNYYLPHGTDFEAAMKKGLIVPGNFLGKLECTRLLTKQETAEWENCRAARTAEMEPEKTQLDKPGYPDRMMSGKSG